MRTLELSPFNRSFIGFDRLTNLIETANKQDKKISSPPYNIEVSSENHYRITMVVAGFTEAELSIESQNNELTVTGTKTGEPKAKQEFIHRGINDANFERKFKLAEHVKVTNAQVENGLLAIELEREIPEALKPRKIAINKFQQH